MVFCDRKTAIRVLEDGRKLNMMDGHFVWIWIDSAQNTSFKNATEDAREPKEETEDRRSERERRNAARASSRHHESVLSDMHLSYFFKNDHFLLFNNRHDGVESSKLRKSDEAFVEARSPPKASGTNDRGELPLGLLSLRPLPIRIDRHLVKGAVKLLVTTLKVILDDCPDWLLDSIALGELKTSCWKELGKEELNFSTLFAR